MADLVAILFDMGHGARAASSDRRDRFVAVIGVFKLVKAAMIGALAVGGLMGVSEGFVHGALHALRWMGATSGHHAVRHAVVAVLSMRDQTLRAFAIAGLGYAAVFAIEGVGLIRRKRWAEWLTVAVTASFMPLEVYELFRRPGVGKVVALVINLAIVVYLVRRRLEAVSFAHGT
jgi:uncharacterized membrane protein (DUF2068 family)